MGWTVGWDQQLLEDLNASAEGCHFQGSLFYKEGKNGVLGWMKLVLSDLDLRKLENNYFEREAEQTVSVVLWGSHFLKYVLKAQRIIKLFFVGLLIPLQ